MKRNLISFEEALLKIPKESLKHYYWDEMHNKHDTIMHFSISEETFKKLIKHYGLEKNKQQINESRSKSYFEHTGYLWPTQNKDVLEKRVETWE